MNHYAPGCEQECVLMRFGPIRPHPTLVLRLDDLRAVYSNEPTSFRFYAAPAAPLPINTMLLLRTTLHP